MTDVATAINFTDNLAEPTSLGRALLMAPPPGTRGMFRLGDLVPTARNVRDKKRRTPAKVQSMAKSIIAHAGVLLNLILVPVLDDAGQWTGKLGVAGGETRRLALCLIRDGGVEHGPGFTADDAAAFSCDDDYLVPGLVVADAEATASSATENIQRTALSPADEFLAFSELYDQCGDVDMVAAFFAVEPLQVVRRLKLANAAPALFQLFSDDKMTIEQLMALCIVDDHARQEAAWARGDGYPYLRQPAELRAALTDGRVNIKRNKLARFVGTEAFEAAGGHVMRDLFSTDADDGYVADVDLLQRLAAEKLEAIATTVRAEAWAWVDAKFEFDYSERSRYGRCETRKRNLSKAEAAQLKALQSELSAAEAALEAASEDEGASADEVAGLEQQCAALQSQITAIDVARTTVLGEAKAYAGAVVNIDNNGALEIHRGLIRPEDRKALKKAEIAKARAKVAQAAPSEEGEEPAHAPTMVDSSDDISRALKLRLGAQRTAALQLVVARDAHLAMVSLAYTLAEKVLQDGYGQGTMRISATVTRDRLTGLDETMIDSPAYVQMQALMDAWRERLPEDDLFGWLRALPREELIDLIAVCSAATINTVGDHAMEAEPLQHEAVDMAEAARLDMADWWEPTGAKYLSSVSKAQIAEAVNDAVGASEAATLAKLPKGEAVAKAEALLKGRRWLPALLRAPSVTNTTAA